MLFLEIFIMIGNLFNLRGECGLIVLYMKFYVVFCGIWSLVSKFLFNVFCVGLILL